MATHKPTDRPEPKQRFTPQELTQAIERNRGRLHVLEYACFGLAHTTGKEAACLTWVIADILNDIDRVFEALE
ncbi:MAG: hypothetical protein AB7H80_03200 [Candidatus Kapaibacterium sp.]